MFSKIIIALILYIILLLLLFMFKPSIMFDINGKIKHYDVNDSLLTLEIVAPILALLCYFIVLVIYTFK